MTDLQSGHGMVSALSQRAADDSGLLARVGAGDERALGALYDTHGAAVYGLALAITQDPERAEAAVAEAFSTVWRDAIQSADAPVALVLLTTAVRRAALASRPSAPVMPGALGPATFTSSEALSRLSDAQRQAVELAWFRGLSRQEIAAVMGEPESVVGGYLRGGLDILRNVLAPASPSPLAASA